MAFPKINRIIRLIEVRMRKLCDYCSKRVPKRYLEAHKNYHIRKGDLPKPPLPPRNGRLIERPLKGRRGEEL